MNQENGTGVTLTASSDTSIVTDIAYINSALAPYIVAPEYGYAVGHN